MAKLKRFPLLYLNYFLSNETLIMITSDWLLFDWQMACRLYLLNVKTDKFSKVLLSKETHAQLKHWTLIVKSKVSTQLEIKVNRALCLTFLGHFNDFFKTRLSSCNETNLKFCQKNILVQILVKFISNHTWNIKCI